jgi:hypothetical protein
MQPTLLAMLLAGAAASIGVPASAATAPDRTEIYLQRADDGRIVLTDRPSPTAVTERSWQLEREDPDVARQRALQVRREAEAVSQRIQRRLDDQQRERFDLEHGRLAEKDRDLATRLAEARLADDGATVLAPYGWGFDPRFDRRSDRRFGGRQDGRSGWRQHPNAIDAPRHRRGASPVRQPRLTTPASPESR